MATRKRTTVADLIAAEAIGAIDGATVISMDGPDDPDGNYSQIMGGNAVAYDVNAAERSDGIAATMSAGGAVVPTLSAVDHGCGIAGCRHGSAHGPTQPDRQLKLSTECGAVIRLTARALATAGGNIIDEHGHTFAVAARRTYNRRAQ